MLYVKKRIISSPASRGGSQVYCFATSYCYIITKIYKTIAGFDHPGGIDYSFFDHLSTGN